MPKVEYSKAKGLVQSSGSGFVMAAETINADGAADPGVALTIASAAAAITLADGTTVGQLKWFVSTTAADVSITPASTAGAYASATMTNIGDTLCCVWTESGWALLSRGSGAVAAANAVAALPVIA